MLRNLLLLALTALVFWLAADAILRQQQDLSQPAQGRAELEQPVLEPIVPPTEAPRREALVADVHVRTVDDLETLFDQIEQLITRPLSDTEPPLVSLVLHGPEVEFFALKNYPQYKQVVDRAAKLAALGAVDIAICQTQMRQRGIGADEVPSFLRQVPFAPEELERLIEQGYVYM